MASSSSSSSTYGQKPLYYGTSKSAPIYYGSSSQPAYYGSTPYYYGGGALVEPLMNDIRDSIPLNLKSISELIPVKHKLTEEQILIGAQAIGMTM